jgi:hypothetical protein
MDPSSTSTGTTAVAAQTAIAAVTVYSDRARITRAGTAPLTPGRRRISVGPLPTTLDVGSVSATLGAGARLLSVEVDAEFGRAISRDDARELIERRDELRREIVALDEAHAALTEEQEFVEVLPVEPAEDENGNERPIALDPASWKAALTFVDARLIDLRARIRAGERRREHLAEQLSDTEIELQSMGSYSSEERKRVVIEVQATVDGSLELELSYTLAGPRWRPSYDLQVDGAAGRLELHRFAVVRQSTGEDWDGATLQLSTAAPQVGAELPKLLAWRLGDTTQHQHAAALAEVGEMDAGVAELAANAPPPPSPAMAAPMASRAAMSAPEPRARKKRKAGRRSAREEAKLDMMMDAIEPAEEAYTDDEEWDEEPEPQLIEEPPPRPRPPAPAPILPMGKGAWSLPAGADLDFRTHGGGFSGQGLRVYCPSPEHAAGGFDFAHLAEGPQSVPADGREHRIPLGFEALDCRLLHEVVAPLEQRAYLRAAVTNGGERPLLAGETFVFLDGGFVARAFVDTVAPGADLELVLGVDEDVKVERRVEQTTATTGLLSKKDRTVYRVAVDVRSYKDRPVRLRLHDQVPITWQEDDIEIETLKVAPRSDGDPDRGMRIWTLDVEAGGVARVSLEYAVERPRDFELTTQRGTA